MERRTLLAGVAGGTTALLAGCSGVLGDEDDPENDGIEPSTDPDEYDIPATFDGDPAVVDFETAPLSASVVGGQFRTEDALTGRIDFVEPATRSAPAHLVAALRNDASFAQTFYTRRIPFLDNPTTGSTTDHDTIYLAPTAETGIAAAAPEATRGENDRWRLVDIGDDWFPETVTLEPDESVELAFRLLGHPDHEHPPIETGRYRFDHDDVGFSVAVWPTDEPGPSDGSTHAGVDVPDLPNRGDGSKAAETSWFHEATSETAVYLRPNVETTSLPGRIEFDFVNRDRESAGGNPYYWRLHKLVDGTWYPVYPWAWNMPMSSVQPGDVDETTLHAYHGDPLPSRDARTVGHLGGGRYAYSVDYSVESEVHAAVFDAEAPDLSVDVEADAEIADEGDRVVVTLPNYETAREPATVTVTRAGSAEERVIAEQLLNGPFRALRNALPLFETGIESVAVRTDGNTALGQGRSGDEESRTISYDGEAYEATVEFE